jgi:integration host factor subunit beta
VKSLDGKGAVIVLDGEVEGYLRASEVARDRVEDIRTHLKEGDPVTAMIINIDRKNRSINLSIKAKDHAEETEAIQTAKADNSGTSSGTTNLGALLRAKMDNQKPRVSEPVMTKSELIDRLAAQFPQLVAKDAELAVKMILDAMAESLAKGERIEIRGFGSFGLNYRPPRTGRNPKSGERVQVPEKHVPHFKAGKELRERVDFKGA